MNNNQYTDAIYQHIPVLDLAFMVDAYAVCNDVEMTAERRLKRCLRRVMRYANEYIDDDDDDDDDANMSLSPKYVKMIEEDRRRRRRR